jgi:L-cysteine:1D-myo-inositol 2-amino-2-deoxy-alpha-D-glucopyranoside ligase
MAIRLALLAHHYSSDWEWTDEVLAEAIARLARWREAMGLAAGAQAAGAQAAAAAASGGSTAHALLVEVRAAMSDDLDAPRALAAIDRWADAVLSEAVLSEAVLSEVGASDLHDRDAGLVRQTADALLGVAI